MQRLIEIICELHLNEFSLVWKCRFITWFTFKSKLVLCFRLPFNKKLRPISCYIMQAFLYLQFNEPVLKNNLPIHHLKYCNTSRKQLKELENQSHKNCRIVLLKARLLILLLMYFCNDGRYSQKNHQRTDRNS